MAPEYATVCYIVLEGFTLRSVVTSRRREIDCDGIAKFPPFLNHRAPGPFPDPVSLSPPLPKLTRLTFL